MTIYLTKNAIHAMELVHMVRLTRTAPEVIGLTNYPQLDAMCVTLEAVSEAINMLYFPLSRLT